MADNGPLLVPIEVTALAVNQPVCASQQVTFRRWKMEYENLANFVSPEPLPFTDETGFAADPQSDGVYLKWTLPTALRRGTQATDANQVDFPLVPNRWLVVRWARNRDQMDAWVVESDFVAPGTSQGTSPFVEPSLKPPLPILIGRKLPLNDWSETRPDASLFLQSMGPNNLLFAAFQSHNENVFSIHDDLQGIDADSFHYMVAGWYSNPTNDPLHDAQGDFQAAMDLLNWTSENDADAAADSTAVSTVYHGLVYAVDWKPREVFQSPAPGPSEVSIALGNTSMDALTAMVEAHTDADIDIEALEALQYSLLDELSRPDGRLMTSQRIHAGWFAGAPGGKQWMMVGPEALPDRRMPPSNQIQALITQLDLLNSLQETLNQTQRERDGVQYQLHELWWKKGFADYYATQHDSNYPAGVSLQQFDAALQTLRQRATEVLDQVRLQQAAVDDQAAKMTLTELKVAAKPNFWQASDPVILIAGANQAMSVDPEAPLRCRFPGQVISEITQTTAGDSFRARQLQGQPEFRVGRDLGIYIWRGRDKVWRIRMNGDQKGKRRGNRVEYLWTGVIRAKGIGNVRQFHFEAAHPDQFVLNQSRNQLSFEGLVDTNVDGLEFTIEGDTVSFTLAGTVRDDEREFLTPSLIFLGPLKTNPTEKQFSVTTRRRRRRPANRTLTAENYADKIQELSLTNVPAVIPGLLGEFFLLDPANRPFDVDTGIMPSEVIDLSLWRQPWQPLYVEWEVDWYPIDFRTNDSANWEFDGVNYQLKQVPSPLPAPQKISGRSILTPKSGFDFSARLRQFIEEAPAGLNLDVERLESQFEHIANWDLASQTLGGFSTQVGLRNPLPQLTPEQLPELTPNESLAQLIGNQLFTVPQSIEPDNSNPAATFEGMRNGQFRFTRLSIVDRFGQSVDVLSGQPDDDNLHPITATGVRTTLPIMETGELVQLPPRLSQAGRLNFTYVSARNDEEELFDHAAANPVVGWILPNHLDGGLAAYAGDGTILGELLAAANPAGQIESVWEPSPNSPLPSLENAADFSQLAALLKSLQAQGADALRDLQVVMDETLWSSDPLGGRLDQNLSVLVGRPIAVVRAKLQFELRTDPRTDPTWAFTFAAPHVLPKFVDYDFAIRLGDLNLRRDGLIGYFQDEDDGTNFDVFNAVHVPDAIATQSSDYIKKIGADGNFINLQFNADSQASLTMLVDPRAAVHAHTGILPVKSLVLPQQFVDDALANMELTFHTGPLLTTMVTTMTDGTRQETILMPKLAEQNGQWTWQERRDNGGQPAWTELNIAQVRELARLSSVMPTLREGLLRLTPPLRPPR